MSRWLPLLAIALMMVTAVGVFAFADLATPSPMTRATPPPVAPPPDNGSEPVELVLATRWSPVEGYARTRRFSQCLEDELARPVRVLQRGTYAEANALLISGRGAVGLVCSGATADPRLRQVMEPVFRLDSGSGEGTYRSIVVVRHEDDARELGALRGASIAWTDPDSLTGYRAPRAALRAMGLEPGTFFSAASQTGSHDASLDAVVQGIVRAAAVDEEVFRARGELPLRVLWRSDAFPSPPVLVRPGDTAVRAALARIRRRPECLEDLGAAGLVPAGWATYDALGGVIRSGR